MASSALPGILPHGNPAAPLLRSGGVELSHSLDFSHNLVSCSPLPDNGLNSRRLQSPRAGRFSPHKAGKRLSRKRE